MNDKAFNRFFYITLAVIAIIYVIGMQLSLMDVDSSTYALISKEMFRSHSFLQVYCNGADYLDKPPLVFWTACLSFQLFGVHDWAYRLPSVLCLALGVYSVYRYAKIFYTEETAKIAALIMASCVASYAMTSDVRTDTMLTGWVMFSLWQLAEFNRSLQFKNILWGGIGIGFAMLTKGPIGLIIPITAFTVEFAYKRQWKSFFRWQYLIALIIIALLLLPMSYGLYEQFDLHPEKWQYDKQGTSGLRFFYWTQSFGRITGESTWNNNPDPFFLFHSFLWSFAPWSVLFIPALFTEIRSLVVCRKSSVVSRNPEAITVGGFVLILLFLSRSKYQLPHYTFAIHPLAAIITAKWVVGMIHESSLQQSKFNRRLYSIFHSIHIFLMFVIYAILFLIVLLIFPAPVVFPVLIGLSFCCFIYVLFLSRDKACLVSTPKIFLVTLIPFVTLIFVLNTYFYPIVLNYQTGSYIAKYINKTAIPSVPTSGEEKGMGSKLIMYKNYSGFAMKFYIKRPIVEFLDEKNLSEWIPLGKENLTPGKTFIYADSANVKNIQSINPGISVIGYYDDHSPTLLSWKFLNPATRNANVEKKVLMRY